MILKVFPLIIFLLVGSIESVTDKSEKCSGRKVHFSSGGKDYVFSWRDQPGVNMSWSQGRKFCKEFCMDLVSLETKSDWDTVVDIFKKENLTFTWTSGRKCNFAGCEDPSWQPVMENGWFWAATKKRIPNPFSQSCRHCQWGPTGALGKRQPDNRQGVLEKRDEGCLAILNNLYGDGIKWHDVACYHKKPILCRDP